MESLNEKINSFCGSIKSGFGSISDNSVRYEFERTQKIKMSPENLGMLLAILENYNLLDKTSSINKDPNFYRNMYRKMKEK